MNFTTADILTVAIALIGSLLGYLGSRKSKAETADLYTKTANAAVESQGQLQSQIDALRGRLDQKEARIDELESIVRTLTALGEQKDLRITELERMMKEQASEKDQRIGELERLTGEQALEIEALRKQVAAVRKKAAADGCT
jgi:chromosome segregation ATPase